MIVSPGPRPAAVIGVGALVLNPEGEILIGHRVKDGETPSWCLPGGHVEAGESFEEAALREVAEETGLRPVLGVRPFAIVLDSERGGPRVTAGVSAHTGEAGEPVPEAGAFDEWRWAPLDRLPAPLFPASAVLLDVWAGRPVMPRWRVYPLPGAGDEG